MAAPEFPKGHRSQARELIDQLRVDLRYHEIFDVSLEAEMQTDKELIKILPCQYCKRPLVVTTFYVLAWAKCSPCKGVNTTRERGSVEVVQEGRTPAKLAADLTKLLINPEFAKALCPVHPNDEAHVMELKTVHISERYGPHEWKMVDGKLTSVQVAPGETVLYQCLKCKACVTYSTTAVTQFRRVNEVQNGKNANQNAQSLGSRDEDPVVELIRQRDELREEIDRLTAVLRHT